MIPLRAVVFGGTGFLGRRMVAALASQGTAVTVATRHGRHPDRALPGGGQVTTTAADVTDPVSVARAVASASAVVNCVGLYEETGGATFQAVHVDGARHVARAAAEAGVPALIHLSGIGSDAGATSPYVRARAEGEAAVRGAFPRATIFRPSVMFGQGDAFLTAIADVAARTPVIPLFGRGETRLQPAWADDIATAAVAAFARPEARGAVYELGGPEVVTYRTVVRRVLQWTGRRRAVIPFPFAGWRMIAGAGALLPSAPITEGQVALMQRDNVVSAGARGFADLGLTPHAMAAVAPAYLDR